MPSRVIRLSAFAFSRTSVRSFSQVRASTNRPISPLRTCLASVSEDRLQQKSVGQRLVKGTNLLTRRPQSDELSVSL